MIHISTTPEFNELLSATQNHWSLCRSKDLEDAFTLAAQELAEATNCEEVVEVAFQYHREVMENAINCLSDQVFWTTSPVSSLIGAIVEAIDIEMETLFG